MKTSKTKLALVVAGFAIVTGLFSTNNVQAAGSVVIGQQVWSFINDSIGFRVAQDLCRGRGAHLPSAGEMFENKYRLADTFSDWSLRTLVWTADGGYYDPANDGTGSPMSTYYAFCVRDKAAEPPVFNHQDWSFINDSIGFGVARDLCRDRGAHLPSAGEMFENKYRLADTFSDWSLRTLVWTADGGYYDPANDGTGSPMSTYYAFCVRD